MATLQEALNAIQVLKEDSQEMAVRFSNSSKALAEVRGRIIALDGISASSNTVQGSLAGAEMLMSNASSTILTLCHTCDKCIKSYME